MPDTHQPPLDEMRAALHGERVGRVEQAAQVYCDYHDHARRIPSDEPIMYECVSVVDLPDWEPLLDVPDTWVLDAARCRDCEVDTIKHPTTGYAEALVMLSLTEAHGIQSIDATSLTVLDFSPADEGYAPPRAAPMLAMDASDVGIARWTRLLEWFHTDPPAPVKTYLEQLINDFPDAPPVND